MNLTGDALKIWQLAKTQALSEGHSEDAAEAVAYNWVNRLFNEDGTAKTMFPVLPLWLQKRLKEEN